MKEESDAPERLFDYLYFLDRDPEEARRLYERRFRKSVDDPVHAKELAEAVWSRDLEMLDTAQIRVPLRLLLPFVLRAGGRASAGRAPPAPGTPP